MKRPSFFLSGLLVILTFLFACSSPSQPSNQTPAETEESTSNESNLEVETETQAVIAEIEAKQESQANDLDTLHQVIDSWNQALNEQDYALLESLYADQVVFYTTEKSKSAVVDSKRSYLEKHPDYQQKVLNLNFQYPSNLSQTAACHFQKVYGNGALTDTVEAVLHLKMNPSGYIIVKESDDPSEIANAKAATAADLPDGKYSFTHHYWLDTRESEVLGHDFVPYYNILSVEKTADALEAGFYYYSGSMRTYTDFTCKDAKLEAGILTFLAAPINQFSEEEQEFRDEDYQYFKFKVLNDREVVLLQNDTWFSEDAGDRYWLED